MAIEHKNLVRAPEGTTVFYEYPSPKLRSKASVLIQSYATRANAKLNFRSINGFDSSQSPVYLLNVTVIKSGKPKQKPGKKSVERNVV